MTASRWRFGCPTLVLLAFVALTPGCVRRTVTITTAPEGAVVVLNDQEVGTSPLRTDFTWYGDYDVIVRKDGYQTLQTNHKIERPWYQYPPMDFVAEVLVPTTIHDQHEMHFELRPTEPVDRDLLIEDAEAFRDRALFEGE